MQRTTTHEDSYTISVVLEANNSASIGLDLGRVVCGINYFTPTLSVHDIGLIRRCLLNNSRLMRYTRTLPCWCCGCLRRRRGHLYNWETIKQIFVDRCRTFFLDISPAVDSCDLRLCDSWLYGTLFLLRNIRLFLSNRFRSFTFVLHYLRRRCAQSIKVNIMGNHETASTVACVGKKMKTFCDFETNGEILNFVHH